MTFQSQKRPLASPEAAQLPHTPRGSRTLGHAEFASTKCLLCKCLGFPLISLDLENLIAGVNRVFRDNLGGLVVDYLGLADQLKKALITYTESGGQGNPTFDTAQAIAVMLEKHGIACDRANGE